MLTVHILRGRYEKDYWDRTNGVSKITRGIKISTNTKKYVYVGFNEANDKFLNHKWMAVLINEYGVQPCRISQAGIKLIKDDVNFVHMDEFMSTFKPTQKMIDIVMPSIYVKKNEKKYSKINCYK